MSKGESGSKRTPVHGSAEYWAQEHEKIDAMLKEAGKGYGMVEMDEGQILEHASLKNLKDVLKEDKQNGAVPEYTAYQIAYKDGHYEYYTEGDELDKVRFTDIVGIAQDNPGTIVYAGKGFKFVSYGEEYGESWGSDDWRIEADDWRP